LYFNSLYYYSRIKIVKLDSNDVKNEINYNSVITAGYKVGR